MHLPSPYYLSLSCFATAVIIQTEIYLLSMIFCLAKCQTVPMMLETTFIQIFYAKMAPSLTASKAYRVSISFAIFSSVKLPFPSSTFLSEKGSPAPSFHLNSSRVHTRGARGQLSSITSSPPFDATQNAPPTSDHRPQNILSSLLRVPPRCVGV